MNFDFTFALSILPDLARASLLALAIAIAGACVACVLGFLTEIARRSGYFADLSLTFVVDAIRVTPVLVQLYFVYFVLPVWGVTLPPLVVGIGVLGIHYASYLAEVFKAGFDAIPKGQFDAGNSLGLHQWQLHWLITLPLVLRTSIAPMGNYFLSILKATPYLSVITINELLGTAFEYASNTFRYYEPLATLGIFFLGYSLVIAILTSRLERYFLRSLGDYRRA